MEFLYAIHFVHAKLAAPTLYQTNKNTICALAAEQLFITTIMPYTNMEEGDLIELFWDGCLRNFSTS